MAVELVGGIGKGGRTKVVSTVGIKVLTVPFASGVIVKVPFVGMGKSGVVLTDVGVGSMIVGGVNSTVELVVTLMGKMLNSPVDRGVGGKVTTTVSIVTVGTAMVGGGGRVGGGFPADTADK